MKTALLALFLSFLIYFIWNTQQRPPGFDYFLLALQWPNAFCKQKDIRRSCNPIVPKQQFTIHGLWPQSKNGESLLYCITDKKMTDSDMNVFRADLLEYWPNLFSADKFDASKGFWIHEWKKHGSCSSNKFPPKQYLHAAIKLGQDIRGLVLNKMEQKGIRPDGTTRYAPAMVLEAIKEATKTSVSIRCSFDKKGNLQLQEIRLCVKDDGVTLRDCPPKGSQYGITRACDARFIFASASPNFASSSSVLEAEEGSSRNLMDVHI